MQPYQVTILLSQCVEQSTQGIVRAIHFLSFLMNLHLSVILATSYVVNLLLQKNHYWEAVHLCQSVYHDSQTIYFTKYRTPSLTLCIYSQLQSLSNALMNIHRALKMPCKWVTANKVYSFSYSTTDQGYKMCIQSIACIACVHCVCCVCICESFPRCTQRLRAQSKRLTYTGIEKQNNLCTTVLMVEKQVVKATST